MYDYRRTLPRRSATDLAVLVPEKPDEESLSFLNDVGIIDMWFTNSNFEEIFSNTGLPKF